MEKLEIKKSKWFIYKFIFLGVILLPILFIGAFVILWALLRYKFDKIEIDENQFYSRLGLLNIDIKTIPLNKISMVSAKTDIISQLLGFGTIEVQSSAMNSTIMYPYIDNVSDVVNKINARLQ